MTTSHRPEDRVNASIPPALSLIGNTPLIPLRFRPEGVTLLCDRAERHFRMPLFAEDDARGVS